MIIARDKEIKVLKRAYDSTRSEFVAVYGRRRVGKTFLVNQTFKGKFTFVNTAVANVSACEQRENFRISLQKQGAKVPGMLKTWFEAFECLAAFIEGKKGEKRKVIFLDELPWMDTGRSRFIQAFEHFWNGFASLRDDILLIVCGSATSWIINNVINNHGGLHNRVTNQLYLRPFNLGECELLSRSYNLGMSRKDILQCYMVLGGMPYYWSFLEPGLSVAQNIDRLCFTRGGNMVGEFGKLYESLFKNPEPYMAIIGALASKKCGMSREEVAIAAKINEGGKLTKYLEELEQCDFIRKYKMIGKIKKNAIYQLIDPFTLFYYRFMKTYSLNDGPLWLKLQGKPKFNTWAGLAYERVCLLHLEQIKRTLGVAGIITSACSWKTPKNVPAGEGSQIDLLIDRDDNVINICEIKYSSGYYEINNKTEESFQNKLDTFAFCTETKKALHLTLITTRGLKKNMHSGIVQNVVVLDDLFHQPI